MFRQRLRARLWKVLNTSEDPHSVFRTVTLVDEWEEARLKKWRLTRKLFQEHGVKVMGMGPKAMW